MVWIVKNLMLEKHGNIEIFNNSLVVIYMKLSLWFMPLTNEQNKILSISTLRNKEIAIFWSAILYDSWSSKQNNQTIDKE